MAENTWLTSVLLSFRSAGYIGKELREARWQALEIAQRGPLQVRGRGKGFIDGLEEVVSLVNELSSTKVTGITEALAALRNDGFHKAASKTQQLSKWRNMDAHPPTSKLLQQIRCCYDGTSASGENIAPSSTDHGAGEHSDAANESARETLCLAESIPDDPWSNCDPWTAVNGRRRKLRWQPVLRQQAQHAWAGYDSGHLRREARSTQQPMPEKRDENVAEKAALRIQAGWRGVVV